MTALVKPFPSKRPPLDSLAARVSYRIRLIGEYHYDRDDCLKQAYACRADAMRCLSGIRMLEANPDPDSFYANLDNLYFVDRLLSARAWRIAGELSCTLESQDQSLTERSSPEAASLD